MNLRFDERGIATSSSLCPICKYNKGKTNKFRVDLFDLSDDKEYFMVNIYVYQGKNKNKTNITEEISNLPTTQKAVVNANISAGIDNDQEGYRIISQENWYTG